VCALCLHASLGVGCERLFFRALRSIRVSRKCLHRVSFTCFTCFTYLHRSACFPWLAGAGLVSLVPVRLQWNEERSDCRLRSSRRFLCVPARNVVLRPLQRSFLLACLACVCLVEASFGRGGKVGWIFCGCPWLCLCTTNTACSVGAGNPFDARLRVWASFGQRSVFAGRCSRGCWSLRFQGMCASALLCMSSRFLQEWCTPCR